MAIFPFDVIIPKAKASSKKRKKPIKLVKEEIQADIPNGKISMVLPIETISEGNCFEPWRNKHARHTKQKKIVRMAMLPLKYSITLPCQITFCRIAPGTLDEHDNLPMSLKYIVDAIASEITGDYRPGRADGNKGLTWKYEQEKGPAYGVKIQIEW